MAPVPLVVAVGVSACLLLLGALLAAAPATWWAFLTGLIVAVSVMIVFGNKAAVARGLRSRDETPRGWLTAMAVSGGVLGVAANHVGRYAGLLLAGYLVVTLVGERIVWRRFDASRTAESAGSKSSLP